MTQSPEFDPQDFGFTPDDTNTANHAAHAKEAGLLISLYQDSEASAAEQTKALHYLQTCTKCRQTLAGYQQIKADLQGYFEAVPAPPPLPSFSPADLNGKVRHDLPLAQITRSNRRPRTAFAPFALQLGMVAVTLLLVVGLIAVVANSTKESNPIATSVGITTPYVPTTIVVSPPTQTSTPLATATAVPATEPAVIETAATNLPSPVASATPTPTLGAEPTQPTVASAAPVPATPTLRVPTIPIPNPPTNTPVPPTVTPTPLSVPPSATAVPPTASAAIVASSVSPSVSAPSVAPATPTNTPEGGTALPPVGNTVTATPTITATVAPTAPPTAIPTVSPTSIFVSPTPVPPTVPPTPTPVTAVADGYIAYISKNDGEIYLIKSDGTANTPLTGVAARIRWQSLTWSNNGRTLAVVGLDNQSKTTNIYLLELGKLPELVAEGIAPVWSPNDKALLYLSAPRADGSGKPTVVTLSTNTIKVLSDEYTKLAPQWFDDGFRVLINQNKIVDTSGKLISNFDVFENSCAAAGLSLEGNLLAVLEAKDGNFVPLIYDLDAPVVRNNPTQRFDKISISGAVGQGGRCGAYRIRWTENSRYFFFYHRTGNNFEVCLVGVRDSSYRCLANLYEPSFNSQNSSLTDIDAASGNVFAIPFGNRPSRVSPIAQARDLPQWQPAIR
jgi:hypothetical protein